MVSDLRKLVESSSALDNLFYQYTHLPLGNKFVRCPYWMNKLKRGILGPFGGKGNPEQIIKATKEAASNQNVDLYSLSEEKIFDFMKKNRIGVDCSGFVFWMLDSLCQEKKGRGVSEYIFCSNPPLKASRANTATLLDKKNVQAISLKDIKVGDLIRLNKGKHVAIVLHLLKDPQTRKLLEIEYAHSSSRTKIQGVHSARIRITDSSLSLNEQEWLELDRKNKPYNKENFFSDKQDGLYRLKIFSSC